MSAPHTNKAMDSDPAAMDIIKYVPIKTYYFKTEEDICILFKTNKIQFKSSVYEIISQNINKISLDCDCIHSKDCVLIEANVNKLNINHEAGFSITRNNNQITDVVFKNVINEIYEFLSSFIVFLNKDDRILIIDGLVIGNMTDFSSKDLIAVQSHINTPVILLKSSLLPLEKTNLLQNKNLAKIIGPGIYLLFGDIKTIIKYTDEEFMLLRIQSYDKCYTRVRKYPHSIHNFNNISEYEIMNGVKSDLFSYQVDILIKKPCKDFLSLILSQQVILYNVKVVHSNKADTYSLYVNGKSTNLKALKVIPRLEEIPTAQNNPAEPSFDDEVSNLPPCPKSLKLKPNTTDNHIIKTGNCSSCNKFINNNNEAQKNDNYQHNKMIKLNHPTHNQVQQYDKKLFPPASSLCIDETKDIYKNNLPIKMSGVSGMSFSSDNSQNSLDSTNENNLEVLSVNNFRCIGPCKPICIEPFLNDDHNYINLISGYCAKCITFTPMSFLKPRINNINNEYKCLTCRNVLFLTFFFKLNFLYGEDYSKSIGLQCYKEKAEDLIKELTNEDIKVKDYLSHYSYRQTVVNAIKKFIRKQANTFIVFYDLPSDNVHILISINKMIDLEIETT
ncbi:uncharacterized protein LOC114120537 [Aphis gossypii]|uniref:Uncharacterized protein n=1 Tax=Aphis gossypii TaxID=80765 RepID=A0A9P0J6D0_APHGO|nr:uncharacterized protein LOC114120537 [Aphis gossypii]CAH1731266.1 unnamed protein product [Aphis gossypii]